MSEFKVEVVRVVEVVSHPNADRLEICKIECMAYSVISAKGNFTSRDLAFYFPIDSVIPDFWVEAFGISSYYNKKLSATKLRGIFSEGLLIPVNHPEVKEDYFPLGINLGDDFTDYFRVKKYEYSLPTSMNGDAAGVIGRYKFPSPENIKRYPDTFTLGEEVYISEKIHGTNFTVRVDGEGIPHVGSHNYFWKIDSLANVNNVYVRTYKENAVLQGLPLNIQVYGEVYGVQDINYGCNKGKLGYAIFAVSLGGKMLDYADFLKFCEDYSLPVVPMLYVGPYREGLEDEWNNAHSVLDSTCIMEGVIVQPSVERYSLLVGRVCMKRISDKYLLRKDEHATEFH